MSRVTLFGLLLLGCTGAQPLPCDTLSVPLDCYQKAVVACKGDEKCIERAILRCSVDMAKECVNATRSSGP